MKKVTFTLRGSNTLLGLYTASAMLVAANAGLPDGFFWTKFTISILLAGIIALRGFLEKPIDQPTRTIEVDEIPKSRDISNS